MDCREFRDNHAAFVDLMCSAIEEAGMRAHLRDCAPCSRHDTVVRRSLLLVKNLPVIEPSPLFKQRLDARLRGVTPPYVASQAPLKTQSWGFAALAAGVVFVTYLATETLTRASKPLAMSPVVATLPEMESSPMTTPTLVATVPTGMSVWPAIMAAGQAQMHFVAAELASER